MSYTIKKEAVEKNRQPLFLPITEKVYKSHKVYKSRCILLAFAYQNPKTMQYSKANG